MDYTEDFEDSEGVHEAMEDESNELAHLEQAKTINKTLREIEVNDYRVIILIKSPAYIYILYIYIYIYIRMILCRLEGKGNKLPIKSLI